MLADPTDYKCLFCRDFLALRPLREGARSAHSPASTPPGSSPNNCSFDATVYKTKKRVEKTKPDQCVNAS
jgi:hypothetical protein